MIELGQTLVQLAKLRGVLGAARQTEQRLRNACRSRCAEDALVGQHLENFAAAQLHGSLGDAPGGFGIAGPAVFERSLGQQLATGFLADFLGYLLAPGSAVLVAAAGDAFVHSVYAGAATRLREVVRAESQADGASNGDGRRDEDDVESLEDDDE